jgi:hypothetical protein
VPANTGIGDNANDTLAALAAASARRQKEAISNIDGVTLFLWQRLYAGETCPCRGGAPEDEPNTDPNVVSIDDSPHVPSVNDGYSSIKVHAVDVSPAHRHTEWEKPLVSDAEPAHHFEATKDSDVEPTIDPLEALHGYGRVTPGGPGQNPLDHEWDNTDGLFSDQLIADFEGEQSWNPEQMLLDNAYLLGMTHTACPLCLNTGFIGGYSLWGGTHRILPVEYAYEAEGAVLDEDNAKVPVWTIQPGGYAAWRTSLPSYFTVAWTLARNNRDAAAGLQFAFSIGSNGTPSPNLKDFAQSPLDDLVVKVTNISNQPQKLTHVDLTVRHIMLKGQVSNYTAQAGLDQVVKANPLTVTLPAEVGIIDNNSIIAEAKYALVWRVTDLDTISDKDLRVTSVSTQTKLVGPSEIEATLFPMYAEKIVAQKLFMGIEPRQGTR